MTNFQLTETPEIGEEQLNLLELLCNASAVSGDEGQVREIVVAELESYADQVSIDALGNVLVSRSGKGESRLRVMLAAHMDEVGFMLTHEEREGIFRFDTVGGLDVRQLAGKPVLVGQEAVPGVIGAKPVHLTQLEDRKKSFQLETLRIDVGNANGKKVKVGDRAVFATRFLNLGPSLRAKALDDRLGVAILIELVKHCPPEIELLAAFTVQEEVGLRGAQVAAYTMDPQLAIVLDCTPANDLPSLDQSLDGRNVRYNTHMGSGPALYIADRATISDPRLVGHLIESAEDAGIPYQIRQPGGGATDAGTIHKQRAGIPSVSVSVPGRYLHTAASIASLEDWRNTFKLVHVALSRLNLELLENPR